MIAPQPPELPTPPTDVEGLITALQLDGAQPRLAGAGARAQLSRALIHRSYAYEHGGLPHNERLEFLGDAVLGVVITESLYRQHPELPEGGLAKLRAAVVNMRALADVARGIGPAGLGGFVLLGRGERASGGQDKDSILADGLEAVLGAVHLGYGPDIAGQLVLRLFGPLLADVAAGVAGVDWKTRLQELAATRTLGTPQYQTAATGPDHAKTFTARAVLNAMQFPAADGATKKQAEQAAARLAYEALQLQPAVGRPAGASS